MFHNDRDGKQGALFACSHKSLLETETRNSGEFSFRFLLDIKKKNKGTGIIHLCVLVLRKSLRFFFWGEGEQ